ncbi:MAG TPA: aldehyde dehydrogenase family protein [Acidimicrobiales bacterium]|nr:aldehyde dehydrogenase family protein [Acidimicrobiales bacterium]
MGLAGLEHRGALYVDGDWVSPEGGVAEDVVNPATEEAIANLPVGTMAECAAALAAARRAFDEGPWPRRSGQERSAALLRMSQALAAHRDELVELVVAETGAPRGLAAGLHVDTTLAHFRFFAEAATWPSIEPLPVDLTDRVGGGRLLGSQVQVYEPYGVVAAITPFNFPLLINVAKIAPALAMGNTVVLKPSPFTPLEAFVLAEAAEEAGLPPGVLNVVTGGTDVGQALTSDPRVDLVTFTGSDTVGVAVGHQAADTLKKVVLELGGKSALVVRADADVDAAARFAVDQYTLQAGQGCSLCTRHLVHNSIRSAFLDGMVRYSEALRVGDPAAEGTTMGPLIRAAQRQRVERYVDEARDAGGTVVTGGRRPADLPRGYFYEPTIVTGVDNSSRVAQEEIFGPVAVVIGFDSDDEAVALANDSVFGLSGAVFSRDSGTAFEMALRMRTGQVTLNGGSGRMSSWAPFGGYKRSGIGREYGVAGVREYCQVKTVHFNAG